MFPNFNQKNTQTTDETDDITRGCEMQSRGPSQFTSRLPPHLVTLFCPPTRRGDRETQWLIPLGTPASAGPSAKQPQPRACGFGAQEREAEAARRVEGRPYRGRSVLLCRVFLAVPSSRGRALCRLDMATVFLRSITA